MKPRPLPADEWLVRLAEVHPSYEVVAHAQRRGHWLWDVERHPLSVGVACVRCRACKYVTNLSEVWTEMDLK